VLQYVLEAIRAHGALKVVEIESVANSLPLRTSCRPDPGHFRPLVR
jgi:hypothetical protein